MNFVRDCYIILKKTSQFSLLLYFKFLRNDNYVVLCQQFWTPRIRWNIECLLFHKSVIKRTKCLFRFLFLNGELKFHLKKIVR